MAIAAFCNIIALGIVVMMAWHAHLTALLQVKPGLAPMQYNTALCFVLCSAGQLLLIFRRQRLALVAGALGTLFAGLTLAEYLLNSNLGVDEFFIEAYLTTQTSQPGRMSLVTAVCFVFAGITILSQNLRLSTSGRTLVIGFLNSAILAISVTALAGYATGLVWTYAIGDLTRMAIHTAAGFTALSIGSLLGLWNEEAQRGFARARWLPLSIGLAMAIATLIVWQALVTQNANHIRQETRLAAEGFKSQMRQELETRFQGLVRMTKRWETRHEMPRAEWEADAALYVEHISGYQAIEWVDPTFRVRWVVPLKGNEAAQDLNVAFEPKRRAAVEAARDQRKVVVSHVIDLVQGGKGFLVQAPIFDGDRFAGLIVGVFRVSAIFEAVRQGGSIPRYWVTVFDGPNEIYRSGRGEQTSISGYAQQFDLEVHGANWRFTVAPEPALVVEDTSTLPEVVLIAGLSLSFLLMLALYSIQVALTRARVIDTINLDLHKVITELSSAQAALRESEERLRMITDNMPALITYVDIEQRYRFNNRAYQDWFGIEVNQLQGQTTRELLGEESYAAIRPYLEAVLSGETVHFERELIAGGRRRYVDATYIPHFGVEGKVLGFYGFAYDTTERRRAEDAVRESEERLRLITDNIPGLVSYIDREQKFRFANRVYQDWLGVEPARLYGLTLREVYGDEAYLQIQSHIAAALAGETVTYEREMIGATGRRQIEATVIPHRDDQGSVLGLYVLISDISARKDVELAQERSQKFLEAIINAIPQSVYVKDRRHRWVLFNTAFCEAMGQPRERLWGKSDPAFLPAEIARANWVEDEKVLATDEPVVVEIALPLPNGDTRWLLKSTRKVLSPEGEPHVVGISTNVTTLKRTQQALREANEFLDSVVENTPHIVLVKDAWDLTYLRWNKAAEDISGITKEELIGKSDYQFFPKEEADFYTSKDREVIQGGKLVDIPEEPIHTRHQGVRLLHTKKLPVFDDQGKARYLIGISEDITERRLAEKRTLASLREKELLLKEVHHRVKNNMQIISSLLQLQSGYFEDSRVQDMLDESQTRIKSMALVHEKLYQTENLALVDFADYIDDLVSMLMGTYGAKAGRGHASFEVHAEPMPLDIDRAIPAGLILNELISNCIKHAFSDGRAGVIRVNLTTSAGQVVLSVSDNGVGLPEGFDLGSTDSLGMRLVHILADQLGAAIEIRRAAGVECVLTFAGTPQATRREEDEQLTHIGG